MARCGGGRKAIAGGNEAPRFDRMRDANTTHDVAILGDPSRAGLFSLGAKNESRERLDVVFPVLHGTYGEDGTLQGLLEMAAIPFVGCGTLASACGMDKVTMKALFKEAGLANLQLHVVSAV